MKDPSAFLGYNLVQAAHLTKVRDDARFKAELGITMRQFGALSELYRNPGLGSGQLARRLFITAQSAGPLVAGLEEVGYVERDRDAPPGVRMGVRITAAGIDAINRGNRVIFDIAKDDEQRLTPEGRDTLNVLLRRFIDSLA